MTYRSLEMSGGGRTERFAFVAIALTVFVYVAVRAFLVPFTQDESASFWLYVHTGEFLPFRSHPDAGNHFLNSLFGIIGYAFAGPGMVAIRWGSLMSFPVYAWGAWCLTRDVSNRMVRWCAMLALLLSPYLLDYFSMFRGYGPAMACWVWALHGLVRYISSGTPHSFVGMAIALFLGVFADLSLLPLWPLFMLLAAVAYFRTVSAGRSVMPVRMFLLVCTAQTAAFVYAATIAFALRDAGLLYHGSGDGFYSVTVDSLVGALFDTPEDRLVLSVTVLVVFALAVAAWQGIRAGSWRSPVAVVAILLCGEVVAREAMFHLLGTNFPQDRTALHLVPLCIALFALAVDALAASVRAWSFMALALLALPVQVLRTVNFGRAVNDASRATPLRFIAQVHRLQDELGRPVMLSGYGQLSGCWAYHEFAQGAVPVPMRPDPLRGDPDDARVVCTWQQPEYKDGYHVADSGEVSGVVLLFRDRRPVFELYADTSVAGVEWAGEYLNLPIPTDTCDGEAYLRFTGSFSSEHRAWDVRLVTESLDSSGHGTRYEALALQQASSKIGTCELDVMRWMPAVPGGERRLYLYDPRKLPFRMTAARVRLYRERPAVGD